MQIKMIRCTNINKCTVVRLLITHNNLIHILIRLIMVSLSYYLSISKIIYGIYISHHTRIDLYLISSSRACTIWLKNWYIEVEYHQKIICSTKTKYWTNGGSDWANMNHHIFPISCITSTEYIISAHFPCAIIKHKWK